MGHFKRISHEVNQPFIWGTPILGKPPYGIILPNFLGNWSSSNMIWRICSGKVMKKGGCFLFGARSRFFFQGRGMRFPQHSPNYGKLLKFEWNHSTRRFTHGWPHHPSTCSLLALTFKPSIRCCREDGLLNPPVFAGVSALDGWIRWIPNFMVIDVVLFLPNSISEFVFQNDV